LLLLDFMAVQQVLNTATPAETNIDRVYLACGATDLCKSIDGLAVLVKEGFALDPNFHGFLLNLPW